MSELHINGTAMCTNYIYIYIYIYIYEKLTTSPAAIH